MEVFIVEAIDPFSPKMGGGEVYSRNLMEYLASNGVGVTLLGVCHSNSSPPNNKLNFIPVARKARLTGYEYFLRLMAKIPFTRIPASTIIHVQRPEYMLPFILFHWKNPKMVTLHGRILEGVKLKKSKVIRLIYQMVESFVLQHSDMIIAVDEATREFYKRQYPQIAAKISVIPIGII